MAVVILYVVYVCVTFSSGFLLHFSGSVVSFPLEVDVFPSILVFNSDLFSPNRFMTFGQRYTTVAFICPLGRPKFTDVKISYNSTKLCESRALEKERNRMGRQDKCLLGKM